MSIRNNKRETIANLFRVLSKTSNLSSAEHKALEKEATTRLAKFGGVERFFEELEKLNKEEVIKKIEKEKYHEYRN